MNSNREILVSEMGFNSLDTRGEEVLRITVVIPSFMHGKYISHAIDSVLDQNYPAADVIVVDGGSTDGTVEILEAYGDLIRYSSETDDGQTPAINKGLGFATGELVTWLNSDDMMGEHSLVRMNEYFQNHRDIQFAYSDVRFVDQRGSELFTRAEPEYSRFILCYGGNLFADPTAVWRKEVLDQVGLLDETYEFSMDYEFWLRCVCSGVKFGRMQGINAAFRVTNANKSIAGREEMLKEHYRAFVSHLCRDSSGAWATVRNYCEYWGLRKVARLWKVFLQVAQRRYFRPLAFRRVTR